MLQDGDGGDVRESLGGGAVGCSQLTGLGPEKIERPDDGAAKTHGNGVGGPEACLEGGGGKAGPTLRQHGEVLGQDELALAVAVQARAFFGLELEKLQQVNRLRRRGHDLEVPFRVDDEQPGGGDVEQFRPTVW